MHAMPISSHCNVVIITIIFQGYIMVSSEPKCFPGVRYLSWFQFLLIINNVTMKSVVFGTIFLWIIFLGYIPKAQILVSHNRYIVMALDILPTYFPKRLNQFSASSNV